MNLRMYSVLSMSTDALIPNIPRTGSSPATLANCILDVSLRLSFPDSSISPSSSGSLSSCLPFFFGCGCCLREEYRAVTHSSIPSSTPGPYQSFTSTTCLPDCGSSCFDGQEVPSREHCGSHGCYCSSSSILSSFTQQSSLLSFAIVIIASNTSPSSIPFPVISFDGGFAIICSSFFRDQACCSIELKS